MTSITVSQFRYRKLKKNTTRSNGYTLTNHEPELCKRLLVLDQMHFTQNSRVYTVTKIKVKSLSLINIVMITKHFE